MSDPVLSSTSDGVTTVTINRPDALNALDVPTKVGLREALSRAGGDPDCRAVLLAGAGERAFCVGQDLREHVRNLQTEAPLKTVREHYNPLARVLFDLDKPVVAAVRGVAAGAGASLAFLADFRVGGPSTSFSMAFAGIGLAADTGASYLLPRLVGRARAAELLMLNRTVRAAEASELGLLTELVETDEEVAKRAAELAARLASGPTVAYGQIKRQLRVGGTFADALDCEADAQAASGATADHRAAVEAFVNKQKPSFEGR
ncbi:MAG TPA: enoyl-CoA hydratase-related protein [Stackebrandtia sp.]|jgi:2-(1,2-epoxy-1,2-dihydrophenyl)acetyl-CoA isomerase|uniref:enoyl-CoA hydratase-related protein n=1 Tax=Stackebrandtia sp. TaxID=2023065 RepID=UPI002D43A6B8|nr:enoyl-CoA hydratase-related protein [Stackebrandtia sp.]HZE38627.1 enoyl-CoA hydratase-related protein [Stackebrandtia sp.]